MKKSLKRVLERLRTANNGKFRRPTSTRGSLEQPQRLQALLARATRTPV